ncbi:pol [Symbiodinium necroappetens]|uniref:Pol protein n=1 Tax=Symbiodinium necroappetens TaxID=1628268 RepID=A0A813B9Q6_9DINO|nr:pol [Symbiodinium necroappetens]
MMITMARLCLRQEEELQLLRMDKQFMIHFESGPQGLLAAFFGIAQRWHEARNKTPPEVKSSLRVCMVNSMWLELYSRLERMLQDETTQNNLHKHEWISKDGGKLLWLYKIWDGNRLVTDTSRPPIEHHQMLDMVMELKTIFMKETEQLVHKFRSIRKLTENVVGTTLPFMLSLSCRGDQADRAHSLCSALSGNMVMQLIGARMRPERAKRHPLADMLAKELDQMKGETQ